MQADSQRFSGIPPLMPGKFIDSRGKILAERQEGDLLIVHSICDKKHLHILRRLVQSLLNHKKTIRHGDKTGEAVV